MNSNRLYSIKLTTICSILFIIFVSLFSYSTSLNGKFIWDDNNLIRYNADVKEFSQIPAIFKISLAGNLGKIYMSYRPLQMLSYMLDYRVWDYNPFGYHLTNCLLHIAVGLLVYWLTRIMFDDWILSFLSASLYVVLPVHTEAVAYISGRADSLAALFLLLSFISFIKYDKKPSRSLFVLTLVSFIFALLSRESAVIFPLLVVLYCFIFSNFKSWKILSGVTVISIVYVILRSTVLSFSAPSKDFYMYTTFIERIPGAFIAIANYIKLLIIPTDLHMEYDKILFSYSNPIFWLGLTISIMLLTYAWMRRKKNKIISFSILWFFICLIPQLNFFPINAYMAEHWLYLASIGFVIVVGYYLSYWWRQDAYRTMAFTFSLLLIGTYSLLTFQQNEYWLNTVTFCQRTLKYSPENYKVYSLLGNAYIREQRYDEAIEACQTSIRINPSFPYSYFNLGLVYMDLREYDKAINYFKLAVTKNPEFINAYNNMAVCYFEKGDIDMAINISKKIIELNPRYARAYYNLVMFYSVKGNKADADIYEKKLEKLGHSMAEFAFEVNAE
jgi:tetratricopeptide (TPR) repeat protein